MNRYQVRISVVERKPANGPAAVFGGTVPDKLMDASVSVDDVTEIRTIVDGLLFEGIPDTQREDEKHPEIQTAGGRWVFQEDPLGTPGASNVVKIEPGRFVIPDQVEVPVQHDVGDETGGDSRVIRTRPIRDNPQA
jgi:hypothetical protein